MFDRKVKSIATSFVLALVLGTGPVACSSAPPMMSGVAGHVATQYSMGKQAGDLTLSAVDHSQLANLDGIKLLSRAPRTDNETKFDVALEVQGLGVQFAKDRTYAYVRADRAFSSKHTVGVRFRFQFL